LVFWVADGSLLNDGNWSAKFIILDKFGGTQLVNKSIPLNSGTGIGDTYTTGTQFVFQILPADSATLTGGKKYDCAVEITNNSINYNAEVARFKINLLLGS